MSKRLRESFETLKEYGPDATLVYDIERESLGQLEI
jgi:hypothetical protein